MKHRRNNHAAVLLMPMIFTRRAVAVLDYPRDIEDFIFYAKEIHKTMTGSTLFSSLATKLSQLNTNTGLLSDAHAGLHTALPTHTKGERDDVLVVVQNNLRSLRLDVQKMADATPKDARVIIEAAGMKVKKPNIINKQAFRVIKGSLSGTAKLIAKGRQGRHAHCWQMSMDGTNWITIMPTLAATTIVPDLARGSTWDFRHCYILKDGPTEWTYFEDFIVG